jgi:hypothetical protein
VFDEAEPVMPDDFSQSRADGSRYPLRFFSAELPFYVESTLLPERFRVGTVDPPTLLEIDA